MHKAILMLLLAAASNNAMAEWVKIFVDDTATIYANISTRQNDGNIVKMQNMSDYKTAQKAKNGNIYQSVIEPIEYDCEKKALQVLSYSMFSDHMGGGKIIHSESFPKMWIPANTDRVDHALWKFACGKNGKQQPFRQ